MRTTPMVSILLANYNYAPYLREAIQSVLDQSYTDFEVIICDNASTDNSGEIIEQYLFDSRVHFYKNPVNIGQAGNWNKCVQLAKGKYLKFLCADDKLHPTLLEKYVAVMESHPSVSLVTANQEIFGARMGVLDLPYSGLQPGKEIIKETLLINNFIGGPTSVMLRASNIHVGNFRSDFKWLPDWDVWLKHLAIGDCFFIPERLICNRIHDRQVTSTVTKNYIARFEEYQFFKEIYDGRLYDVDPQELKKVVKAKAANCAGVLYKVFPSLANKSNRSTFKKAMAIAIRENVILQPLLQMQGRYY